MGFSVVMASYLGKYRNAAKDRIPKFHRAVQSVIDQTYTNWELIVVSDGCDSTVHEIQKYNDPRIRAYKVKKQRIWSGTPRNIGIQKAKKDYIIYLDTDDMYTETYLSELNDEITDHPWYFVDDMTWNGSNFVHRKCDPDTFTMCGTCNVIHKKLGIWWNPKGNYAHDWDFIKMLQQFDYKVLNIAGYKVMHIMYQYDI